MSAHTWLVFDNLLDDFRPHILWKTPATKTATFLKREGFALVSFHIFGCYTLQISRDTRFAFPVFRNETRDMFFSMECLFKGSFTPETDQVVKILWRSGFSWQSWSGKGIGYLKQQHIKWLFPCQVFSKCNCFSSWWFQPIWKNII